MINRTVTLLVALVAISFALWLFVAISDASDLPPAPVAMCEATHRCRFDPPTPAPSPTATPEALDFVPINIAAPTGYVADHEHILLRWYYPTEAPAPSLEEIRAGAR